MADTGKYAGWTHPNLAEAYWQVEAARGDTPDPAIKGAMSAALQAIEAADVVAEKVASGELGRPVPDHASGPA